jgi:hypothetical protein
VSAANDFATQVAVGVGVALVVAWVLNRTAKAAGAAINPTDRDNLAYRGVNAVGEAVSGERGWTLGGWLYDVTHGEYEP